MRLERRIAQILRRERPEPAPRPEEAVPQTARPVVAVPQPAPIPARFFDDARLFADRDDLLRACPVKPGGVVAEIGVAAGGFTRVILNELRPAEFVAFDPFDLHHVPVLWGTPSKELFEGKTHLDFYRDRFASYGVVKIERGFSQDLLATYPDRYFDFIYVDGAHDYDGVKKDALLARDKIRPGGFVIFNDYVMNDCTSCDPYGVVQAVNEIVNEGGWKVIGLGLQAHMFCDIALRRDP